jgi:hypothetical protein
METISFGESSAYYRGVLTALRFLEQRRPTGRRFGPEADLRWSSFRGHLLDIDRVELMVRDADAEWPGALGARRCAAARSSCRPTLPTPIARGPKRSCEARDVARDLALRARR